MNPNSYRNYSPAEERSALEAAELPIELGADGNAQNASGQTALHAAAYSGLATVVELLVAHGAKMDVMDKWGQTPLSIASNVIAVGLKDASAPSRGAARLSREVASETRRDAGGTVGRPGGSHINQVTPFIHAGAT